MVRLKKEDVKIQNGGVKSHINKNNMIESYYFYFTFSLLLQNFNLLLLSVC